MPNPARRDDLAAIIHGSRQAQALRPGRLQRRETGMLESLGSTLAEESLWQVLVDQPPATVGEISEVVGVSARTVGALLAELEAKGLVIRLADGRRSTPSPVRTARLTYWYAPARSSCGGCGC